MKRTHKFFRMTFLFSFFLLIVNTWGASYISFNSIRIRETGIYIGIDIIDTNGKNLRNLTDPPESGSSAAWAPDGRSFAFTSSRDGNSEIYIKTFDVAQERRLTNQPGSNSVPAWSPDGNWIAFTSTRTQERHIYKIDINGENLQRLTHQGKYNNNPAWSPDGRSIVFESIGNDGLGIYEMDADGKHQRQIINQQHVDGVPSHPVWSPHGSQIACAVDNHNQGSGIYIMDIDGQDLRRVSPLETRIQNPAWSPDGKWIAYDAEIANHRENSGAVRHIFIVSVEGGEPRQITQRHGQHYSPTWVPESFFSVSPTVDTQTTLWGSLKQAEHITQ